MILIIGAPGSGKDTQCKLIERFLPIKVFSMGEYLRSINDLKISNVITKGNIIDIETFERILSDVVSNKRMILNGIPRNVEQAIILDKILLEKNIEIKLIINLKLLPSLIIERLVNRKHCSICNASIEIQMGRCSACDNDIFCFRGDDEEEIIRKRIYNYLNNEVEIEKYYKHLDCYYEINGNDGILNIRNQIKDLIVIKNFD